MQTWMFSPMLLQLRICSLDTVSTSMPSGKLSTLLVF